MSTTLQSLAQQLRTGQVSSRELVEGCLTRALDPQGEGARTFTRIDAEAARAAADRVDAARKAGQETRPWAGIPISVKDLFDLEGQVTTAGSKVLAQAAPATRDAAAVQRLKEAGLVVIGRTNMTEFAYSGLGLNPHYGTPACAYDRSQRRIPGGSSSGAAISVTDGMAYGALGTDTGGSCRIPAALNGLVGFKPTARRVPQEGTYPLSASLDSVGPIAATVQCCAILDALLSGTPWQPAAPAAGPRWRLGIPQHLVLEGLDAAVSAAFSRALTRLSQQGFVVEDRTLAPFAELPQANAKGGLVAAEAYALHRRMLEQQPDRYDPRVKVRIEKGAQQDAQDYADLQAFRQRWIAAVTAEMEGVDFLVCPTVPTIAPTIAELDSDDVRYGTVNLAMLRNPTFANFLDGCAISVPCHAPGEAPVGLMLIGRHGDDLALFQAALAVEAALTQR